MIANFTEIPGRPLTAPATHRNEFPVRYSLAGWSPPEPASASLTALILQSSKQPVQENPANGNCPNSRLSQKRAQATGGYVLQMGLSKEGTLVCHRELVFGKNGMLHFPVASYQAIKTVFDEIHRRDTHTLSVRRQTAGAAGAGK